MTQVGARSFWHIVRCPDNMVVRIASCCVTNNISWWMYVFLWCENTVFAMLGWSWSMSSIACHIHSGKNIPLLSGPPQHWKSQLFNVAWKLWLQGWILSTQNYSKHVHRHESKLNNFNFFFNFWVWRMKIEDCTGGLPRIFKPKC